MMQRPGPLKESRQLTWVSWSKVEPSRVPRVDSSPVLNIRSKSNGNFRRGRESHVSCRRLPPQYGRCWVLFHAEAFFIADPMGRISGFLSTVGGIAAVVVAIQWLRQDPEPEPPGPVRPPFVLPVTTVAVQRGDLRPTVELTGSVRAPSTAELSFQRGGRIEAILVRDGDHVAAGSVVARLSSTNERLALAEAQANLGLVRSELERVRVGERPEVIERLMAERDERDAELALARLEVERGEKLVVDDFLSRSEQDRREAELAKTEARAAAARSSLALAEAGTRAEDITVAESRLKVAEAALARRQAELDLMQLTVPRDVIVINRMAAPGDYVAAGAVVLRTVDGGDLEIELEIPASYSERLGANPQVTLFSDEIRELHWQGPLATVVPVADPRTRNFRGLIPLGADDPAASRLRPGQFVRASLALEPVRGALLVPVDALRVRPEGEQVVKARSGPIDESEETEVSAQVLAVRVLASDGEQTAIEVLDKDGQDVLSVGDRLLVRGLGLAYEGAPLLVRDDLSFREL